MPTFEAIEDKKNRNTLDPDLYHISVKAEPDALKVKNELALQNMSMKEIYTNSKAMGFGFTHSHEVNNL